MCDIFIPFGATCSSGILLIGLTFESLYFKSLLFELFTDKFLCSSMQNGHEKKLVMIQWRNTNKLYSIKPSCNNIKKRLRNSYLKNYHEINNNNCIF